MLMYGLLKAETMHEHGIFMRNKHILTCVYLVSKD